MPIDISEKNFETTIEQVLQNGLPKSKGAKRPVEGMFVPGGYRKRLPENYHRAL